jgi:hypothetical protein
MMLGDILTLPWGDIVMKWKRQQIPTANLPHRARRLPEYPLHISSSDGSKGISTT